MAARISGIAVAQATAGFVLLWSGLRNVSIRDTLTGFAAGKVPAGSPSGAPVLQIAGSGSSPAGSVAPATTNSQIANRALAYQGHCYIYGGAPGTNGQGCWDCSSFVNWVTGHDLHMSIPGFPNGSYSGAVHGPATGDWGVWSGLHHITRAQVAAGDIVVWTGHMGIAISNSEMISAQDPADGTRTGPIDGGGNGPLLCYGRLIAAALVLPNQGKLAAVSAGQ